MAVAIEKSDEQINASDFHAFEAALGCRLPDDYREFLLNNNGGRLEPNEFAVDGGRSGSEVRSLFGYEGEARLGRSGVPAITEGEYLTTKRD
jgi:hypothetical protein